MIAAEKGMGYYWSQGKNAAWQAALLLLGAAMLGYGVWRGEVDTVLSKAIKLCLECVGIG